MSNEIREKRIGRADAKGRMTQDWRLSMRKWYSLADKIYRPENLKEAFKRVKRNHGAPGIDGETVEAFEEKLKENIEFLHVKLKTDTYEPSPVRRVEISKPDGGKRLLGIPTVKDRVVQQAVLNIIEGIFNKEFHSSSYGYGLSYVVDMDLSECFDTSLIMVLCSRVSKKISDGKVLKLIEKFLKAGVMEDGSFNPTEIGSPQGGLCKALHRVG